MALALLAAVAHAVFGALQKGRHDPWLTRGAIDICYSLMALPVALFVVPWPEGRAWAILAGAIVIHFGYKLAQAMAYSRGAFTVVYPIVRGTGPLVTVLAAGSSSASATRRRQWLGVLMLSGGILALAAVNLRRRSSTAADSARGAASRWSTGGFVAVYTTYDAYGIRATPDPFTFLAWFFLLAGSTSPGSRSPAGARWPTRPSRGRSLRRGVVGGARRLPSASARSCSRPASTRSARRRCCARPRWSSRR